VEVDELCIWGQYYDPEININISGDEKYDAVAIAEAISEFGIEKAMEQLAADVANKIKRDDLIHFFGSGYIPASETTVRKLAAGENNDKAKIIAWVDNFMSKLADKQ